MIHNQLVVHAQSIGTIRTWNECLSMPIRQCNNLGGPRTLQDIDLSLVKNREPADWIYFFQDGEYTYMVFEREILIRGKYRYLIGQWKPNLICLSQVDKKLDTDWFVRGSHKKSRIWILIEHPRKKSNCVGSNLTWIVQWSAAIWVGYNIILFWFFFWEKMPPCIQKFACLVWPQTGLG